MFTIASFNNHNDWAFVRTKIKGGLKYNNNLSENLHTKDKLEILGYPFGLGAKEGDNISPMYSDCMVSTSGLQGNLITITDSNFDYGNSGGPVFINQNGNYLVIGIVSAKMGNSVGFIIPISALYK
ncbi:MAG: S1C family serine protease, partial [Bacteroidota bacterium]|nr:S1C family serine protease [Bacteroidota bacterium]